MSLRSRLRVESLESRDVPSLTPLGLEFQVNTVTQERQWQPAVAMDAAGDYVIAFTGHDNASSTGWGIFARLFHSDGTPVGNQFLVAEAPSLFSNEVAIAMSPGGSFVVAWANIGDITSTDYWSIQARQYDANGTPLGSQFVVQDVSGVDSSDPDIAMGPDGSFAISWFNYWGDEIRYRRFSATGLAAGSSILVNIPSFLSTSGQPSDATPRIAMSPTGNVTVSWTHELLTGRIVDARSFGPDDVAMSPAFMVNMPTGNDLVWDDIVVDSLGHIAITWQVDYIAPGTPPTSLGISSRVITDTGTPLTPEVSMYSTNTFCQIPKIGISANGMFIVTATVRDASGDYNVAARAFASDGMAMGDASQVNTFTPGEQSAAAIGMNSDGDAVISWRSMNQDGSSWGVYAQRYQGQIPHPCASIINNGSKSRSDVKSAVMNFNRPLVLPANPSDAFVLTGPMGVIPVSVDTSGSTPAGTNLKFTFPTYPNGLPDGQYTLTALALQIHDTDGQALDGNGDGVPGDNYVMNFHRLLGDFNGDGTVSASDVVLFRQAFGTNNLTFDLDGDGTVDANDFILFRMYFGATI
jgi:hypothetical protein